MLDDPPDGSRGQARGGPTRESHSEFREKFRWRGEDDLVSA